jgi:hypothetical protein
MNKKIRDFKCMQCGIAERLVWDRQESVICTCGKTAKRMLSAPRVKGNTTGKSPSF